MTLLLFILGKIPNNSAPQLLIIKALNDADTKAITGLVSRNTVKYKQKSLVVKNGTKEMIFQVKTRAVDELVNSLNELEYVSSVTCLEHDGELRT